MLLDEVTCGSAILTHLKACKTTGPCMSRPEGLVTISLTIRIPSNLDSEKIAFNVRNGQNRVLECMSVSELNQADNTNIAIRHVERVCPSP